MAVKYAELRTVGARDEFLVHLPGYGAVVAVLRDTLFEIEAVNWHVIHNAWASFRLIVIVVTSKFRARH